MNLKLPITVRVPLVVSLFLIAVSVFASELVLNRLEQTQSRHIRALTNAYLEGLSIALVDALVREDTWQVFDILDRSQRKQVGLKPVETVVTNSDGIVIASTDALRVASQSVLPRDYVDAFSNNDSLLIVPDSKLAFAVHKVVYEGRAIGSIYAKVDVGAQIAERGEVLRTLIATNALLTLAMAGLAALVVGRMMRPIRILTRHLEASGAGTVRVLSDEMLGAAHPEYRRVFAAYNTLAKAMQERETLAAQLAEEERLASLGRLASGMAHEINNPLGGLFNAIDTLKRHGDQPTVRAKAIDLVERGLRGIRDVVRSTLMTYRADRDGRSLRPEDMEDLFLLLTPEARRCDVLLDWRSGLTDQLNVPASAVRQILLNLVLNACHATPRGGRVRVNLMADEGRLELVVEDNGPGFSPAANEVLSGSGVTPAPLGDGTGLGLWMTNRLVRECNGHVSIENGAERGTRVVVRLPLSNSDELKNVA